MLLQTKFLHFTQLLKRYKVFLYDNLANIYVLGTYYTLQCAGFQWEMLPSLSLKLSKKMGGKMRESKVL